MAGLENGSQISVSAYPVVWGVDIVSQDMHHGSNVFGQNTTPLILSEQFTDTVR